MGQGISSAVASTKELYGLSLLINLGVFFLHALPQRSEKYYDLTGSLAFGACTVASLLRGARGIEAAVASGCLLLWCNRLGWFLLSRVLETGGDRRFDKIKDSAPSFLFAWLMQATWVYLVGLPVYLLNAKPASSERPETPRQRGLLSRGQLLALVAWAAGFLLEVIADAQKRGFSADPSCRGRFISTGLWSVVRHPNYAGEILMWLALACFSSLQLLRDGRPLQKWAPFASPILTFCLLRFLSGVPMLERQGLKRWGHLPEYRAYLRTTPRLLPTWGSLTRIHS
ncbi:MAG: DUF1295 domain-containing protein [archaeon]|nr:DUF1295 domain-containing protein [archaeon]